MTTTTPAAEVNRWEVLGPYLRSLPVDDDTSVLEPLQAPPSALLPSTVCPSVCSSHNSPSSTIGYLPRPRAALVAKPYAVSPPGSVAERSIVSGSAYDDRGSLWCDNSPLGSERSVTAGGVAQLLPHFAIDPDDATLAREEMQEALFTGAVAAVDALVAAGDAYWRAHRRRPASINPPSDSQFLLLHNICAMGLCTESSLIYAVALLRRLHTAVSPKWICSANARRVVVASILIATKVHDDTFYSLPLFSDAAKLTPSTIHSSEIQFLKHLSYGVLLSVTEFELCRESCRAAYELRPTPPPAEGTDVSSNASFGRSEGHASLNAVA